MLKRFGLGIGIVVALLVAFGGVMIARGAQSPGTAAPPRSSSSQAWDVTSDSTFLDYASNQPGQLRVEVFGERHGGEIKVTKISGNTITGTNFGGQTVTITVSSTTKYIEAGSSAALKDVHVGSEIAVRGARTSANSLNATAIIIVLPSAGGVVTNIQGSTITVTGFDAVQHTITVRGSTKYDRAGKSAGLSDVKVGSLIQAEGTQNSDESLTAQAVHIILPHVAGKVTAIQGSTITISGFDGTTYSIDASSATFGLPGAASASLKDVKVNSIVIAEGALDQKSHTLNAVRVEIPPAMPGPGKLGGFGRDLKPGSAPFRGQLFQRPQFQGQPLLGGFRSMRYRAHGWGQDFNAPVPSAPNPATTGSL